MNNLSREDMMIAISRGVCQAFEAALADIDLSAAVAKGAEKALDQLWPSQIHEAILQGVREAMRNC